MEHCMTENTMSLLASTASAKTKKTAEFCVTVTTNAVFDATNVPSQTFYSPNSRRIAHVSLAFTLLGLLQRYVAKSNCATSEIPLT